MKRIGLIGRGLAHSVSAAMQQAALDEAGLDVRYEVWDTEPAELEARVAEMRRGDCLGANVTVPHKEAIIPLLDELDPVAQQVGAVNTIVVRDGRLVGHNTDVEGFRWALAEAGFDPAGQRTVILGAGGAARAVAHVLIEGRASTVFVVGRSPRRVEALVASYRGTTPTGTTISWAQWGDGAFLRSIRECQLLVNCTPVGTRFSETEGLLPLPADLIPAGCLAFDLVYNPIETPFLAAARARGARTFGGLPMLVYQGQASFRLWTGQEASYDTMLRAAREAMAVHSLAARPPSAGEKTRSG